MIARLATPLDGSGTAAFWKAANDWLNLPWIVGHFDPYAAPPLNSPLDPKPDLPLQPAEIVCHSCRRRTAHVPITWSNDTDSASARRMILRTPPKRPTQVFTLNYQCQACHSLPTVFLVARDGDRLRLEGRSPLELVEVAKHIPDREAPYFRDAILAHASGRTLAALFYLRTTIEQFARRIVNSDERATGDELMEAYGRTLPDDVRSRMPSFKELYARLSAALHSATADEKLFDHARDQIAKHFDIRRALEI